jgi:hypothetical protein
MFTRAALLLLVAAALPAYAEMIPVGTIMLGYDFDLGAYTIQIANFTGSPDDGGFAIPPDYPVLTPLRFDNPSVSYTALDDLGAPITNTVFLDPIFPGYFASPDTLIFDPSTTFFTSIVFSATVFPDTFLVGSQPYNSADGTAYALLEHADGSLLSAYDAADIQVGADPTGSTDLPEPAPALLLASGALACVAARKRNAA